MKTGSHLKIKSMGDAVLGVTLEGNPHKPEPIYFRVQFPGGEVDIVRQDNGEYWVHLSTGKAEDRAGVITDARLDVTSKPVRDTNVGDFNNPGLYHVAMRVKKL